MVEKNLVEFCSCPENLSEARFKSDGIICLLEEISRQHCGIADAHYYFIKQILISSRNKKNMLFNKERNMIDYKFAK